MREQGQVLCFRKCLMLVPAAETGQGPEADREGRVSFAACDIPRSTDGIKLLGIMVDGVRTTWVGAADRGHHVVLCARATDVCRAAKHGVHHRCGCVLPPHRT